MEPTFVLLHSPLVGPSTWRPVAEALPRATVPDLRTAPPYWPEVVEAVRRQTPQDGPLVLVAHSNAGLLVPVISNALGGRVVACVFADTHLPPPEGTVPATDAAFLPFLRQLAGEDGHLPRWTDWWDPKDVAPMRLDPQVVEEQPRLPLDYFEQDIPVPSGWDTVPCHYLWYGPPYGTVAHEARRRGWPATHLPGHHLHHLTQPEAVAGAIMKS